MPTLYPEHAIQAVTWFDEAFPIVPYRRRKLPRSYQMLILLGYDISSPKRLAKVARVCQDYGLRVQYSLFECHLDEETFETLWLRLLDHIDDTTDRLVAYRIDATSAKRTRTAGTMICHEPAVCYLI